MALVIILHLELFIPMDIFSGCKPILFSYYRGLVFPRTLIDWSRFYKRFLNCFLVRFTLTFLERDCKCLFSHRFHHIQSRLESELAFVRAQQLKLEEMLLPLEDALAQEAQQAGGGAANGGATYAAERERTFQLAETIDSQVSQLRSALSFRSSSTSTDVDLAQWLNFAINFE